MTFKKTLFIIGYFMFIFFFQQKVLAQSAFCKVWTSVGSGTASGGGANQWTSGLTFLSSGIPYAAFADNTNSGKLSVKKFINNTWTQVGTNGLSVGTAASIKLVTSKDDTLFVAYIDQGDGNKVYVKKYNGSAWMVVGTATATSGAYDMSFALDTNNIPHVIYSDIGSNSNAIVKKYNGSSWVTVGSSYVTTGNSGAGAVDIAIGKYNNMYIAVKDNNQNGKAFAYRFNGSIWTLNYPQVNTLSVSAVKIACDTAGIPYIAYIEPLNPQAGPNYSNYNYVIVTKYNSNFDYFTNVSGNVFGFTVSAGVLNMNFSKNNNLYLGLREYNQAYNTGRGFVYSYDGFEGTDKVSAGNVFSMSVAVNPVDNKVFAAFVDQGASSNFIVKELDTTSFTPIIGDSVICEGSYVTFSDSTIFGNWSTTDANITQLQNSNNAYTYYVNSSNYAGYGFTQIHGNNEGYATIKYAKTGCIATKLVHVIPSATVDISSNVSSFYTCGSATISASTTTLGATIYYQGLNSNGTSTADTSTTITITSTGAYYFRALSSNGCWGPSASKYIYIASPTSYSVTGGGSFCTGPGVNVGLSNSQVNVNYFLYRNGVQIGNAISGNNSAISFGLQNQPGVYYVFAQDVSYYGNLANCGLKQMNDSAIVQTGPASNVSAGNDQSICIGQSTSLTATGGVTYSWNNGISNGVSFTPTSSNTYIVSVTDVNGCIGKDTVSINVNPLPTVNAGADKLICPGSSTSLTASGAITYSWTGGITNGTSFSPSATTTYVVTGTDANNCSNNDTVVVNVRDLTIKSITPVICKGVADTLTAPSGSNYQWKKNGGAMSGKTSRVISLTVIGSYTVTYTDSLCGVKTTPAVVLTLATPPAKPVLAATKAIICPGDTTTIYATTSSYKFIWFLGSTTSILSGVTSQSYQTATIGSYYIKAVDSFGCRSAVSGAKIIKAAVVPIPAMTVANGTLGSKKLTCTNNSGTYQWRLNGSSITGATAKTYIATQTGAYSVRFTNGAGCTATTPDTTLTINYTGPKMSQEALTVMNNQEDIIVYPNPSSDIFFIEAPEATKAIVTDLQGRKVLETNDTHQINLKENPSGIYFLQLINEEGMLLKTEKLMKQ